MATSGVPIAISRHVARRYLLGWQGLWPGRRWRGKAGAAEALRTLGAVQMDPMTVVARSHDLVLWSRVDGYDPAHLDELLYRDRAFFDYGGHLDIYHMDELPYWRLHMRRRALDERQAVFAAEHGPLLDAVRAAVRARGPLGSRDLAGRARVPSYRGRKDTALALYHLWLTGELMTHSRQDFERRYDLRERIAPSALDYEATEATVERHVMTRGLAQRGLFSLRECASALAYRLHRPADRTAARAQLEEQLAGGHLLSIQVEGQKEGYYAPAAARSLLADLAADRVPQAWRPVESTTDEEATFLSPLDNLLDRARTRALFDFEYLWEVYKPAARRRWGAYTMPVLYGDRLVARIDPKLERQTGTLRINGFWPEDASLADDPAFAAALARGLSRFARFHAARTVALDALHPEALRARVETAMVV